MPRTKLSGSRRRNLTKDQDRTSGKPLEVEDLTQRLRVLQAGIWKKQMGPLREIEYSCAVKLRRQELLGQSAKGSSLTTNNRRDSAMSRLKIVGVMSQVVLRQSIQFPTHELVQQDILMTLTSWLPKVKCQRQALRS